MADRIKGIVIEIGGDTTKLSAALGSVEKQIRSTQSGLQDVNRLLKLDPTNIDLIRQKQELLSTAVKDTRWKLEEEREALEQLREKQKTLTNAQEIQKNAEQQARLTREIADTERQVKKLEWTYREWSNTAIQAVAGVGVQVKKIGEKATEAGKAFAPVSAAAAGALGYAVNAAVEFESAFTGVMKTVDETAETTYTDLSNAIKQMSTETASSKTEIARVMEAAGQLGISADHIVEFTRTMIALGDTTNLSAEEAATALARFINVTGTAQSEIPRLGAALVDLGNHFATTESDILAMAVRLAGAGAQIGLTEGDILGLATAMSSVGIEAEMGGSAFSKAMVKMQVAVESGYEPVRKLLEFTDAKHGIDNLRDLQLAIDQDKNFLKELGSELSMTTGEIRNMIDAGINLQSFAEVANMEASEFVQLFGTDAVSAIGAFISGLADTESHGATTIQMLQDMGFTEVRLRDTLTRAANASDLFTEAVRTGNAAFEENLALNEEAEKRYDTTETKISQTREAIGNLAVEIGQEALPIIRDMLEVVKTGIDRFSSLDESTKKNIVTIGLLVAAVSPALLVAGSAISAIGTLLTLIPTLSAALTLLAGNPVTLVIAAVAGIGLALKSAYDNIEWFREKVNAFRDWFRGVADSISAQWNKLTGNIANGGGGGHYSSSGSLISSASVRKFRSAYDEAMILTSPAIFGASGGRLLAGGDGPGPEAVVGTNLLMDMMRQVLSENRNQQDETPIVLHVDVGGQFFDRRVLQAVRAANYRSGGR